MTERFIALGLNDHNLTKVVSEAGRVEPKAELAVLATRPLALVLQLSRRVLLAMLDLNDFKQINDTHGHQVGDRVPFCAAQ